MTPTTMTTRQARHALFEIDSQEADTLRHELFDILDQDALIPAEFVPRLEVCLK